jgi:putative oxidoreductase
MAELIGAALLVLGLFTRPALLLLIVTMAVAVFDVHGSDDLSDREHALIFLVAYVGLFFTGPGKFAMDAKLKS